MESISYCLLYSIYIVLIKYIAITSVWSKATVEMVENCSQLWPCTRMYCIGVSAYFLFLFCYDLVYYFFICFRLWAHHTVLMAYFWIWTQESFLLGFRPEWMHGDRSWLSSMQGKGINLCKLSQTPDIYLTCLWIKLLFLMSLLILTYKCTTNF